MEDLRKVILIVDDIELNRAILKELFFQSYCVAEAENGLQALEAIKKYGDRIAIILLDIVMPELDGFAVCRPLRQERNNVPVIILTAREEEADKVLGLEIGADD